jgi:hypothetical protein
MAKKLPKNIDTISITLFPKNKKSLLDIKYNSKPAKDKFLKPIKMSPPTTSKVDKPILFEVVGLSQSLKTKASKIHLNENLSNGDVLILKHEYKNKFDNRACAVYWKNKKIGYVEKSINQFLIEKAQKMKFYKFYVHTNTMADFFEHNRFSAFGIPVK